MTFELPGTNRAFEINEDGQVFLAGTNRLVFFKEGNQWHIVMPIPLEREDWEEILEYNYARVSGR